MAGPSNFTHHSGSQPAAAVLWWAELHTNPRAGQSAACDYSKRDPFMLQKQYYYYPVLGDYCFSFHDLSYSPAFSIRKNSEILDKRNLIVILLLMKWIMESKIKWIPPGPSVYFLGSTDKEEGATKVRLSSLSILRWLSAQFSCVWVTPT